MTFVQVPLIQRLNGTSSRIEPDYLFVYTTIASIIARPRGRYVLISNDLRLAWIVLEQQGFISEQSDDKFGSRDSLTDLRTDLGGGVKMAVLGVAAGADRPGFARVAGGCCGVSLTTR